MAHSFFFDIVNRSRQAAADTDEKFEYCGVNHVALVARDMAETVDFYTNVLEMPLVKTINLPDGRGQHFFFDCGNGDTIAFFWFPNAPKAAPGVASQHLDIEKNGAVTAHGSMNHLALGIPLEKFDRYVEKLRAKGISVRVLNHEDTPRHGSQEVNDKTFVRSMYFVDPNGIKLEFAVFTRPFRADDVKHAPVDAEGRPVDLKTRKMPEPA